MKYLGVFVALFALASVSWGCDPTGGVTYVQQAPQMVVQSPVCAGMQAQVFVQRSFPPQASVYAGGGVTFTPAGVVRSRTVILSRGFDRSRFVQRSVFIR